MKRLIRTAALLAATMPLSSCFLVSIPVKATGEMIEKSAEATGRAMNRGIHRVTRPNGGETYRSESWDEAPPGNGVPQDNYTPLLPAR